MTTTPFRSPDHAAECERLRDAIAERDARIAKLTAKRPHRPWTNDQRAAVMVAVSLVSGGIGIVGGCVAWWAFADSRLWLGGSLVAVIMLCLHMLIAAITDHWEWWRGIGGGESS